MVRWGHLQYALPLILIGLVALYSRASPYLAYSNASASAAPESSSTNPQPSPESSAWPSHPEAAATQACTARLARYQGVDNPWNATLVAAYPARAEDVAAEDERIRGSSYQSPFRVDAPGEFLALCYFDADAFGIAAPPGHPIPPGAHNRLKEVVRPDGSPYVLVAARRESIKPEPVPASRGG